MLAVIDYEIGNRIDNITDWALRTVQEALPVRSRQNAHTITKEAIFHYVYGVLHDPVYREKYALNLKREFPRIPFYKDFWQWADWGKELMDLHIGYESVTPAKLKRIDVPDEKARKAGLAPKCMLKADKDGGRIIARQRNDANRHPARSLGLQTRQPLRARMDSRPVQRKETQRPDHPREVQHLPLRRLQREGHRPADARDDGERSDCSHRNVDEKRAPMTVTLHNSQEPFHLVRRGDSRDLVLLGNGLYR